MKSDEKWLLNRLYEEHFKRPRKFTRDIIEEQEVYNHKRLWYILKKFDNKKIVDCGTSLAGAWLTDKGIELAKGVQHAKR